ncbi:MAG TPA: cation diffusion facilitator family transporter [Pyrinomonadaceae bacterium]|nr:cation diffusion facilitator family transporter [Pyrinomonadaceae bacterium]HMP66488.1 cation diffusion facilitator family transporter [Pyrinomonadaceae bacterium]
MSSGHTHRHDPRTAKGVFRLKIALAITFIYMIAEAIGGWLTNSLALIADAGHMLTDVGAMSLTLFAFWFAGRPATSTKTYGYYRIEILAAFVNGIALVLLALWIIYEAIGRFRDPIDVLGGPMTIIAFGGLAVNLVVAYLLHSEQKNNLNLRGAWMHVMGDLLGSVAAIVSGLLIILLGFMWADPLCSILISSVIIIAAWRLINESVNVLLEGTPRHIDLARVEEAIVRTEGVDGVHDLHVWTISSGIEALSAHITHDNSKPHSELLVRVRSVLSDRFGIEHLTIQMESMDGEAEAVYICEKGTRCFEPTSSVQPSNTVGRTG